MIVNEGSKTTIANISKIIAGESIHFQIDSTTALSSLVKMGVTKNEYLIELEKEIWKYLLYHGITITAEYLAR